MCRTYPFLQCFHTKSVQAGGKHVSPTFKNHVAFAKQFPEVRKKCIQTQKPAAQSRCVMNVSCGDALSSVCVYW